MERIHYYLKQATLADCEDALEDGRSSSRIDCRSSDTKSIGSLSQRLFESDNEEDADKYLGTCNGHSSQPGSKSNLLLCSECDIKCRSCTYRPQTPNAFGRFVEERLEHSCSCESSNDDQNHHADRRRDEETRDETSDTGCSSCPQCSFNGTSRSCIHCDLSDQDEGDLICFRCQSNVEVCSQCDKCERKGRCRRLGSITASSSDESRHVTKIQLNNKTIDIDSDEAGESDHMNELEEESMTERLATIAEAKGDTASENGEDETPRKLNGSSSQAKFLNYVNVLFV